MAKRPIAGERTREARRREILQRMPGKREEDQVMTEDEKKERFLQVFAKTRNIQKAAKRLSFSAGTVRRWRRTDVVFDAMVEEIWNDCVDDLEGTAMNLAIKGHNEPVFFNGDLVGYKNLPSPAMQQFMLKAHRPDRYREHSEISISPEKFVEGIKRLVGNQDEVAQKALLVDPIEVAQQVNENEVKPPEVRRGASDMVDTGSEKNAGRLLNRKVSAGDPREPREPKKKTPRGAIPGR